MKKICCDMPEEERVALLGGLIDVVEDWLEEKGFSPKDFPSEDRQFPPNPDEAIIFGDDYGYLADGFAKIIGIEKDCVDGKNERKKQADQLANDILAFVNTFGHDDTTFSEKICKGHRTLQQSVMRLFISTIQKMSEVDSDGRNAATVELARKITEIAKDYPLPFI